MSEESIFEVTLEGMSGHAVLQPCGLIYSVTMHVESRAYKFLAVRNTLRSTVRISPGFSALSIDTHFMRTMN